MIGELDSGARQSRPFEAGTNLQDIADRLSEMVGNPITIEGVDFELIAHSRQVEDVDDVRKATILQRRVPEPVVRALWSAGVVEDLVMSRTAVRVEMLESVGLEGRVAIAVRIDDEVVAHIWVQETHRVLEQQDLSLLEHAANMVALELLNIGYRQKSKERMVSGFLDELLVASEVDETEAQVRASRFGLALPELYQLIVVRLTPRPGQQGTSRPEATLTRIVDDITFRHGIWSAATHHPGHGVVLVGADEADAEGETRFARLLLEALKSHGFNTLISVGDWETGFRRVPMAYELAVRCLSVAELLGWHNVVVTGASLGVLQLLPVLARTYATDFGGQPVHSGLAKLLAGEEQQGGFSMVDTLEAFLDCGGDARRTAARLHIHVNTLNYRLRRIYDRTGLDMFDGRERLAIHMELKLRRLVEQQHRSV